MGCAPGVRTIEGGVEIEDPLEIPSAIRRLAHEQAELNHGEDNVPDVFGTAHAPVLQHEACRHPEALQGEVPYSGREFATIDMAALRETRLVKLERRQDKEVGVLVKPGLAGPDLIPDSLPKRNLGHVVSSQRE